MKIKIGNILEAGEQYICHQCNSVSHGAAGLAFHVFEKFPWSNIYYSRNYNYSPFPEEMPGNIIIKGNGENERFVINIMGQYYPGYPQNGPKDDQNAREKYFLNCLDKISKIQNIKSIAFPYLIGCGLAGGDWNKYEAMILDFSNNNPNIDVVIYKLPEFA